MVSSAYLDICLLYHSNYLNPKFDIHFSPIDNHCVAFEINNE